MTRCVIDLDLDGASTPELEMQRYFVRRRVGRRAQPGEPRRGRQVRRRHHRSDRLLCPVPALPSDLVGITLAAGYRSIEKLPWSMPRHGMHRVEDDVVVRRGFDPEGPIDPELREEIRMT